MLWSGEGGEKPLFYKVDRCTNTEANGCTE